jgi:hypothetical protein
MKKVAATSITMTEEPRGFAAPDVVRVRSGACIEGVLLLGSWMM